MLVYVGFDKGLVGVFGFEFVVVSCELREVEYVLYYCLVCLICEENIIVVN